ncbi:cellulose binding domain-containing protein [Rugosimonospora africana]|uniref:Fibronectin type III domain-containing protein n=1 Tax=Rugosimonospora africana TaxID=556532 RepID=A0A8J3QVQ0_9ACTN|nr:cellulose binding domain-containing protein [Rugosimonospora africana]GIH17718.1 hypothetical protein Raf01_58900 [Rugosimonospora africana]
MPTTDSATTPRRDRPRLVAAIVLAAAVVGAALIAVGSASAGTVPMAGVAVTPPGSATGTVPPTTPGTSPFPPSAPTNLVATEVTTHSATLTWTASTAGCCAITGYGITSTRPFTDVPAGPGAAVGNVTTGVLDGLQPGAQYSITVDATDSLGHNSAPSNVVTLTTPVSDEGDNVPPSAPTNLTLVANTLSWQPSTDNVGVTGYQVYRYDGFYSGGLMATVTGTSYTVPPTATFPPSGTGWKFYVRAIDSAGNVSVASNLVPLSGGGYSPSPSARPTPGSFCAVTYANVSQWPHGFIADVTIRYTGTAALSAWTLDFTFAGDQRITFAHNATFFQSGADATLRNTSQNGIFPPNSSVTVRLTGTWHSSNAAPTIFRLGGNLCTTR